jgi:hypothetical protein
MGDPDNSLSKPEDLIDLPLMPNLIPRKKEDRRRTPVPASLLGGFLREDRRKGNDRRRKTRPDGR